MAQLFQLRIHSTIILKRVFLFLILGFLIIGCDKPIHNIEKLNTIALVSVSYNPTIYKFTPHMGIDKTLIFSEFNGTPRHRYAHEELLNEFLVDFIKISHKETDIKIIRPLTLLNTSILTKNDNIIRYEHLIEPYEPIQITNTSYMAGLCQRLKVDAVIDINITFALYLDEKTLWEEYQDPYAKTLYSHRMQLQQGYESSELRTIITVTVVDKIGRLIYKESRYIDSKSENITITNQDLTFPGGVSPKLIALGLKDWLNDWQSYLP